MACSKSVSSHLRSIHLTSSHQYDIKNKQLEEKAIFGLGIRMINLSLIELKLIAKNRDIKDYENKSEDDLIKIFSESKTKMELSKKRIKKIREKFNE